jgi:hypothetical protein
VGIGFVCAQTQEVGGGDRSTATPSSGKNSIASHQALKNAGEEGKRAVDNCTTGQHQRTEYEKGRQLKRKLGKWPAALGVLWRLRYV